MKKAQKIILVVIILLALVVAVGAYAYFATDIFKSPSELFAIAFMGNVNELKEFNNKPFDEIFDKFTNGKLETVISIGDDSINKEDEKDTTTDIENDLDATSTTKDIDETPNSTNDQALNGIITYVSDATVNAYKLNTNIRMGKASIFDFNFAIDKKKTMGLKVKGLHDKYIAVENRDLKKLAKNIGLDEEIINYIPDQISNGKDYSSDTIQKLKDLLKKYFRESYNTLNKDSFSIEKKVSISINNQEEQCDKYMLSCNSRELIDILLVQTFENIIKDPEFLNLLNTAEVEKLKNQVDNIKAQMDNGSYDDIKISIYVSNNKTIQTVVELADSSSISFRIENGNKIIYESKDVDGKSYIASVENQFDGKSGKIIITKDKQKTILNVSKKDDKITIKNKINDTSITEIFNLNSDVKIDELTEENAEIINDYTEEDFTNLLMKMMENIKKELEENPMSLIGMLGTMDDEADIESLWTLFSQSNDETDEMENDELGVSSSLSLTTTNNTSTVKKEIANKVTQGLKDSISEYEKAKEDDDDANLDNYLTVENVQEACDGYCKLELIEGVTLKVTLEDSDEVYYAVMNINFDDLSVSQTTVYTESEYRNL